MTSPYSAIIIAALSSTALLSGKALEDRIKACPKIITQEEYEATGNHLVLIKKADLAHFPKGFLCPRCEGHASMSSIVFDDGSTSPPGFNATAFLPLDKNGLPRIWPMAVLGRRFAGMRFLPPRVSGKPVCVHFDAGWSSATPHEFSMKLTP
jgi:hypothetical protein